MECLKYFKSCPIFVGSALFVFTKFNHFFLNISFLTKNISSFVSLPWKLDNPHCHTEGQTLRILYSQANFFFCFQGFHAYKVCTYEFLKGLLSKSPDWLLIQIPQEKKNVKVSLTSGSLGRVEWAGVPSNHVIEIRAL